MFAIKRVLDFQSSIHFVLVLARKNSYIVLYTTLLLMSNISFADSMTSLGFEYVSGKEGISSGDTGLVKLSYMKQFAGPLSYGIDVAVNIEQLIFDDISSNQYEHESYLNLNIGVLNNVSNKLVGFAYVGVNFSSLERDLSDNINDEEDTIEIGNVVGVGFGYNLSNGTYLSLTLSRIDDGEGFEFVGVSINIGSIETN